MGRTDNIDRTGCHNASLDCTVEVFAPRGGFLPTLSEKQKSWFIIAGAWIRLWTRPSILCVTQKRAFMPLYIVLGQQRACMPVYIGKSGDLVGWHRCLTDWLTDRQQKIGLLSFSTVSSLSWVTQLKQSIKSQALEIINMMSHHQSFANWGHFHENEGRYYADDAGAWCNLRAL